MYAPDENSSVLVKENITRFGGWTLLGLLNPGCSARLSFTIKLLANLEAELASTEKKTEDSKSFSLSLSKRHHFWQVCAQALLNDLSIYRVL
jgi:hypothetical protein